MWIPIKGFEEEYAINEYGDVKNIKRDTLRKPYNNGAGRGYLYIDLYRKHVREARESIHRLVAKHFIDNPENKPMINHKDGDTMNNHYTNLEWVTALENVTHASNVLGVMNGYKSHVEKQKRQVAQIKDGVKIKTYESIAQASRETKISTAQIIMTCRKIYKHTHGYQWEYV